MEETVSQMISVVITHFIESRNLYMHELNWLSLQL